MRLRVGNDVVDLRDPDIATHHQRRRFVERVCTADEVDRVSCSDDAHLALWSLFAAKEAGFKVVAKLTPGIAFSPRRFQVNAALTQVCHEDVRLRLQVTAQDGWVHAVAVQGESESLWAVERRCAEMGESVAVRQLAVRLAAQQLGLPVDAIAVERDEDRRFRDDLAPPRLLHDGRPLPVDLSLSHDGPWVACALL